MNSISNMGFSEGYALQLNENISLESELEKECQNLKKLFEQKDDVLIKSSLSRLRKALKLCCQEDELLPECLEWAVLVAFNVFCFYGTLLSQTIETQELTTQASNVLFRMLNDFPWVRVCLQKDPQFEKFVTKCFLSLGGTNKPTDFFMEELVTMLWCNAQIDELMQMAMVKGSYIELLIMCAYHKPNMKTGFLFNLLEILLNRLYRQSRADCIFSDSFNSYFPEYGVSLIMASGIRAAKNFSDSGYFIDFNNYGRRAANQDQSHVAIHCLNCLLTILKFDGTRMLQTLNTLRKEKAFNRKMEKYPEEIDECKIYGVTQIKELIGRLDTINDIHHYRVIYEIFTPEELNYEKNHDKELSQPEFFLRLFKYIEMVLNIEDARFGETRLLEYCHRVTLSIKQMSFSNSLYLSLGHEELMKYIYDVYLGRGIAYLGGSAILLIFSLNRRVFCSNIDREFPDAVSRIMKYLTYYREYKFGDFEQNEYSSEDEGEDEDEDRISPLSSNRNMFRPVDGDGRYLAERSSDTGFHRSYYTVFYEILFILHSLLENGEANTIFFYNNINMFKQCLRNNNKLMRNDKIVEQLYYLILTSFSHTIPELDDKCLDIAMELVKDLDTIHYTIELRAAVCTFLKTIIRHEKLSLLKGPNNDGEPARKLLPILLDSTSASYTEYSEVELRIMKLIAECRNNVYSFAQNQRDTINLLLRYKNRSEIDEVFSYVTETRDLMKYKGDYRSCLQDLSNLCNKMIDWIDEKSGLGL